MSKLCDLLSLRHGITRDFFPTGQSVRYTKDYKNPKQPNYISEFQIAQWSRSTVRDSTRYIARVRTSSDYEFPYGKFLFLRDNDLPPFSFKLLFSG